MRPVIPIPISQWTSDMWGIWAKSTILIMIGIAIVCSIMALDVWLCITEDNRWMTKK